MRSKFTVKGHVWQAYARHGSRHVAMALVFKLYVGTLLLKISFINQYLFQGLFVIRSISSSVQAVKEIRCPKDEVGHRIHLSRNSVPSSARFPGERR